MKKKITVLLKGCILSAMIISLMGCGSNNNVATANNDNSVQNEEVNESEQGNISAPEAADTVKEIKPADILEEAKSDNSTEQENSASETTSSDKPSSNTAIVTDLKYSEGFEFESNGDGTCTITGIGVCADTDIVIPVESPNGDTVTLIDEYALYNLEDVNSITLVNYNYEIDKNAFQYGEFKTVNIIGGSPVLKKSAFSSCEDLTLISFSDCNIQAEEYAFYSCGKDADVIFSNCTGTIEENAFQYSDFSSLTITNCEFEIEKSAFSSCEDLTSIVFTDSKLETEEYAFYSCGDSAKVEMTGCTLVFDDRTFQYSSFDSLTITDSTVEMGDSTFSSCEDLATVNIDCSLVTMGEYAFYGCEDLINVAICENSGSDNEIKIDDRAFQYCKRLEAITIGSGSIEIGEYVFSGCADNLKISIDGNSYTVNMLDDGFKQ